LASTLELGRHCRPDTPTGNHSEAGRYEIRLTGHLDARWAAWFDGLTVSHEADGTSVLITTSPHSQHGAHNQHDDIENHPFGRSISNSGRDHVHDRWAVAYFRQSPRGLSSVTTDVWVLTHSLTIAVSFFGLLGITGIYARQVEEAGWLGLAGFLLFSLWLVLVPGFTFFEALILPLLAVEAPTFAAGFLGIFTGSAGGTNFGTLATIWTLLGPIYILGPLLFGIATFRAGILSRWAAGVFGLGSVSSVAFALLPPDLEPLATAPVGVGLAWLGYALLTERRGPASEPQPSSAMAQRGESGAP